MPGEEALMGALGGAAGGSPFGLAASATVAGLTSLTGLFQKIKGNKLLKSTHYPIYSMPKEVSQNQELAKTMAATGMPSAQYNQAMKNVGRNSNAAIRRANDRRSGLAAISSIQQAENDATLKLDAEDARQRTGNQRVLLDVNNQAAAYRDKEFEWNKKNKYERDYNYAMGLIGMGNQNLMGGLDKAIAGLTTFGGGGGFGGGNKKGQSPYSATNLGQQGISYSGGAPNGSLASFLSGAKPNLSINNSGMPSWGGAGSLGYFNNKPKSLNGYASSVFPY